MRLVSASARRSVVLCLVALVPVAVLAVSSIVLASRQVTSVVDRQVQTTAAVSAEVFDQQTGDLVALVHSYATRPSLVIALSGGTGSNATVAQNLQSLAGATPGISASFVADIHGTSLNTYPYFASAIGKNFAFRDWFKGLVASGRPYVSNAIETQEDSHTLAVTITDYVRDAAGHPVAVLGVNYSLESISAFAAHVGKAQGIELKVTDRVGTSLTAGGKNGLVSLADDPRVRAARAGRTGLLDYAPTLSDGRRGPVELSAYAPVTGPGWTVVASKDKDIAFAGLVRLRTTVLAITSLLVLIILTGVGAIVRSDRRRRDSEGLVQTRDRELAKVLESTDEGFFSIDADGAITRWNTQAEKIYGWGARGVGPERDGNVVAAEFRQEYTDDLAGYRPGRLELVGKRVEMTARHRNGHEIPLEVGVWAHDDGDGFSAFVHDITERVAIQTALETERRRLTEAQRLGQMGGFECDLATDAWTYSEQMYELWGVAARRPVQRGRRRAHPRAGPGGRRQLVGGRRPGRRPARPGVPDPPRRRRRRAGAPGDPRGGSRSRRPAAARAWHPSRHHRPHGCGEGRPARERVLRRGPGSHPRLHLRVRPGDRCPRLRLAGQGHPRHPGRPAQSARTRVDGHGSSTPTTSRGCRRSTLPPPTCRTGRCCSCAIARSTPTGSGTG